MFRGPLRQDDKPRSVSELGGLCKHQNCADCFSRHYVCCTNALKKKEVVVVLSFVVVFATPDKCAVHTHAHTHTHTHTVGYSECMLTF